MDQHLTLQYIPGSSFLHRLDTRCTIPALCASSMGIVHMSPAGLGIFSVILAGLVALLGRWKGTFPGIVKGWIPFLLLVFAVQSFSLEPAPRPIAWLPATRESLGLAALSSWRLALLIAYASLFAMVTSPRQLEKAMTRLLARLPFIPARRVGMMVSLTLRFLPLLLLQAREVGLAFRCRLGGRRKNPLARMRLHAVPILRKSLVRADEVSYALAARGYRDDLPLEAEPIPGSQLALLLAWIGITVMTVWMA
ncbi:MAG: energy-coupling factor transporter transmembrane protein EcfT [Syntrophobacteraceae bacterium]|jgi:energy-coupling factor transporter transmembrane protein EcfT|nr:energy-coupling factor transporter transmembrane protein EcfT [Syntrophobacteraceae bacterium]